LECHLKLIQLEAKTLLCWRGEEESWARLYVDAMGALFLSKYKNETPDKSVSGPTMQNQ